MQLVQVPASVVGRQDRDSCVYLVDWRERAVESCLDVRMGCEAMLVCAVCGPSAPSYRVCGGFILGLRLVLAQLSENRLRAGDVAVAGARTFVDYEFGGFGVAVKGEVVFLSVDEGGDGGVGGGEVCEWAASLGHLDGCVENGWRGASCVSEGLSALFVVFLRGRSWGGSSILSQCESALSYGFRETCATAK